MHLCRAFERTRNAKLYCKLKKYEFGSNSFKYLGLRIANRTVSLDLSKTEAIGNWPAPTYIKEL